MSSVDQRVQSAPLGAWHYQILLERSFVSAQSKANFVANTIKARNEANYGEQHDRAMQFFAQQYGLSVDDLKAEILRLDSVGYSISQIHAQLGVAAAVVVEDE